MGAVMLGMTEKRIEESCGQHGDGYESFGEKEPGGSTLENNVIIEKLAAPETEHKYISHHLRPMIIPRPNK